MNFEESRLRTFRNWPANAPVDPRRIAKAGFYYMGQNLEVQCFSCGGRISEWNYNDKVMTRHRILDPQCPFVRSPALSGNIPISNGQTELTLGTNETEENPFSRSSESLSSISNSSRILPNQQEMHQEANRLKTFSGWPVSFIVSPQSLAEAGFYYVQQGDKVRCAFCSVIIGRWEAGDIPATEHRRHSPSCSFAATRTLTSSETDKSSSSGITFRPETGDCSDGTMKSLGVQIHKVAKHPKYSTKDSRLATFNTWPLHVTQSPEDLADAGFFYPGNDDQVRCFHCDGGLRKWDSSDDPWVEHARWFPDCGFVTLVKGEDFVSDSIQLRPPVIPEEEATNVNKREPSELRESIQNRQVTEEELERLLSSPTALAALQIGLDLSRVKMALRQKLEQTGSPFSSPHDLIEATLDIQLDEVPFQDSEDVWATPLHSPVRHKVNTVRPLPRHTHCHQSSDSSASDSEPSPSHTHQIELKPKETSSPEEKTSSQEIEPSQSAETDRKVTLEEENRRLKEARLCKICMDSEVCIVFLPCGHLVTCVNCAHSLAACPVCRRTIKATVRTFLS